MRKTFNTVIFVILGLFLIDNPVYARAEKATSPYSQINPIPVRLQWNENSGYCGEVSLISAGLLYGQYLSQYDVRAISSKRSSQTKNQLLLGVNDKYTATQLHLNAIEWNTETQKNTPEFLAWVKKMVLKGYPVAIGVYTNMFLFYEDKNPHAGDKDYDHIVPVIGIGSNHALTNTNYFKDDVVRFSDNGLWAINTVPDYDFTYTCEQFPASRIKANAINGSIYSLPSTSNYGIAITGVMDENQETLPVSLETSVNDEINEIKEGSNSRPAPSLLTLTITVSNLEPAVSYILYRYNKLENVPHSNFNASQSTAWQSWEFTISSGSTHVMRQTIQSNEMAIYRAVKK